ncbi:uncharacterized protein TNCV_3103981 [Trichonephila clavipes]|nr:uncharacterized protein TNCV_3103981 [Trichonephila clavipes]
MFRMIFIDESQRDLLRIVWKDSIDDSIKTYRMNRVVYGTTCAPFLAQRVLKRLVTDDGHKYPGAGMQLHKWSSNCIELLSNFDVSGGDVSLTITDETKALGLLWRPQKDTLAFSVSSIADVSDSCTITKRSVLSTTAKIFDPLGLISPVVTKAKLVMQELWRLKLDWKDSLPIHLETQWKRFVKSLAAINNLNIPRYILLDDALRIELHGYCDSSLRAYGAAIYVKCLHNSGTVSTNLLCSKSRVAPLKSVTIPRLELCAAVLLAKLIRKTIKSMKISFNDIVLWTDSTIVLAWIKRTLQFSSPLGIDPDKIQDSVLWWYGPSGLQSNPVVSTCDVSEINDNDLYLREFKKSDPVCLVTQNVELLPIINKCSSFVKLKEFLHGAYGLKKMQETIPRKEPLAV